MEETTEIIKSIIALLLTSQCAYAFALLIVGNTLLEYYEWGIFEKPKHWVPKTTNFILKFIFGIGPFLYKKLNHHSWLAKKALFLLCFIGMVIGSFIIYLILSSIINIAF